MNTWLALQRTLPEVTAVGVLHIKGGVGVGGWGGVC